MERPILKIKMSIDIPLRAEAKSAALVFLKNKK